MINDDAKDDRSIRAEEDYRNAIHDEEPLVSILRVHLSVEYFLDRIIAIYLVRGDKFLKNNNRISHALKISLVDSFGCVDPQLINAITKLNEIRNQCAHKKNRKITFDDVEYIGRTLGKKYDEDKRRYENTVNTMINVVLGEIHVWLAATVSNLEDHIASRDR